MAPTNVGEEVLDLVISYIHNVEDRNSLSLVSRKFYELDGIMRKRLTVHSHYYPNLSRLSKRFPFMEMLRLKGFPRFMRRPFSNAARITPWTEQLALEFRCLKELCIHGFYVHDEDLEKLARTRGKDLTSLKISKCLGFSTDGLMHISKYCNKLSTLCLKYSNHIDVKDGIWLHQLALNSMVLERLHATFAGISSAQDLTLLAKKCCNSLISLKIRDCHLSELGDTIRYAVRLDHFGGTMCEEEDELVDFELPPNIRSLSIHKFAANQYSIGLPFLNHIRKLKLAFVHLDEDSQCLLFKRCPNLEVLYTDEVCGDRTLEVIGKFCKKLRKLTHYGIATHYGLATHVGLIALAKGCTKIECLQVRLGDISNEAIKCLGTHLKNLRKFSMYLAKKDLVLDNGFRTMLRGCSKLETLYFCQEGLTDVGLEYIGKYGVNLRSLSLCLIGISKAGLVKLSKGCPKLRKLNLKDCPFSKQVVSRSVFNITSLRYVWGDTSGHDRDFFALTRPVFPI